ncbi:molybdopterin molybdochelatase [Tenacibaculum mesophilum]|uniref:Molybdopterin molybdenumtransferase n=1 Tax=Tenacibaculum mesophilum TaxID=104268 RepID=A0ABM7CH21_9FLAO|nr:molybdopterin molybdotransferase MoeA [Tenacibaculum mesophilum]AZJ33086.1 molybdopterin molybdenumtransferase MoeA [Tenacibaculum mesophilum]QFS28337.1 molybdopterin molybdenumtransferase MoeA [Tenacibaculum mesophilum]SHF67599.1 molybdopterin molybdochelatase [Tenacibaculum mesophilum]
MITVEEAKHIVLENTQDFGIEEIPFLEAVGRVLKEDIVADRDFPPFNRVAMDGIAINHRFFEHGVRDFKIEGIQAAGSPQQTLDNAANCYEVMTGAVLPNNTDTVIRYEDVDINTLVATITIDEIKEGQNIHIQGSDKSEGTILIKKNTIISAAEIGVLATVGKATVKVAKQPKVMIVSTGDELVDVNEYPLDHQIRRSNVYTLVSLLNDLKIPADTANITDEKQILKENIASFLQEYDVLLFSGAVSKGKFDFLPEVLDELGVKKLFHRVSQRPGKPFWAGVTDNCKVFAFPGNPVSTFVNCLVYFYPWYYKSIGVQQEKQTATLAKNITFKPNLSCFLQVKLTSENGQVYATPIQGNGSGDLASLVEADSFIELPKTEEIEFKKGSVFPILTYRGF